MYIFGAVPEGFQAPALLAGYTLNMSRLIDQMAKYGYMLTHITYNFKWKMETM